MATDVKPRSNRLLMVIGIVIAVVAFLLVILFGRGGGGGTSGSTENTDVVLAAVDIPAGTMVSAQLVVKQSVPTAEVPGGAFSQTSQAVGQFAAIALPKNTILTASNTVSSTSKLPAVKKPYLDIPKGEVAIPIPAGGELQNVGGYIQTDDRVDVLVSGMPGQKAGQWKTVLQNVIIRHVGPLGSANTQGPTSSYLLYVPLDVAEEVNYIFSNGTFKFVLKSQLDAQPTDQLGPATTAGASQDNVNSKYGIK